LRGVLYSLMLVTYLVISGKCRRKWTRSCPLQRAIRVLFARHIRDRKFQMLNAKNQKVKITR